MSFLPDLLTGGAVARAILVLGLVASLGLLIGQRKVLGVRIGIVGVLFSGLLFGHFGVKIDSEILEFVREFGLIFFVYAVGMQVGPGFFASWRRQGIALNLLAVGVVVLGTLSCLAVMFFGRIPPAAAIGLYTGAVTNTPGLAAAQQTLREIAGPSTSNIPFMSLGYALAYPFGIIGTILVMMATRLLFHLDPKTESKSWEDAQSAQRSSLRTIHLEVTNTALDGEPLAEVPGLRDSGVVVSRVWQNDQLLVAKPETVLHVGDILLAVGSAQKLQTLQATVGRETQMDLRKINSAITSRQVLVTRTDMVHRTLEELNLADRYGVAITRVIRGEVELVAMPALRLQFGDSVRIVGEETAIEKAAGDLGNSRTRLEQPPVLPVFIGLALGVFIGSITLPVPGMASGIRLGLAGGPLLVAMVLARIYRIGPVVWYLPGSANYTLRELGIVLFLSCVGLKAGDQLLATFLHGGWEWMLWGTVITVLPAAIGAFIARAFLKMNYLSLCGWLAGCMTNPPALAFAGSYSQSDAHAISYATVYPLVMLLRVLTAQVLVLFLAR